MKIFYLVRKYDPGLDEAHVLCELCCFSKRKNILVRDLVSFFCTVNGKCERACATIFRCELRSFVEIADMCAAEGDHDETRGYARSALRNVELGKSPPPTQQGVKNLCSMWHGCAKGANAGSILSHATTQLWRLSRREILRVS